MRVWIVNYYTSPDCSNPRYLQLAKHFMAKGWDVTTFYANYNGADSNPIFKREIVNGLDFVQVRVSNYEGNGIKRMYSIWTFAWRLLRHCKRFERPDVILHNIHTPFDYPVVWVSKKLKAKYIAEAWDLWPDEFANYGLVSRKNPAMKFFYWAEKRLYYHADKLVFTFLGGIDYIKRKGWTTDNGGKIDISNVYYINNGVDLKQFDFDKDNYPRNDEDINKQDIIKIIYVGSINLVNHVKTLIDAASLMKEDKRYHFFIYGDGAYRDKLEEYVKEKAISNVTFKEKHIPFQEVAWVVSQATVNVMNYEKGFGNIGVSSGKLFQYLAAGKPIVCNVSIAYDDVITNNRIGIAKDLDTAEDFAEAIQSLTSLSITEYNSMCERVRKVAEQFDYNIIATKEIDVINMAVSNG